MALALAVLVAVLVLVAVAVAVAVATLSIYEMRAGRCGSRASIATRLAVLSVRHMRKQ